MTAPVQRTLVQVHRGFRIALQQQYIGRELLGIRDDKRIVGVAAGFGQPVDRFERRIEVTRVQIGADQARRRHAALGQVA